MQRLWNCLIVMLFAASAGIMIMVSSGKYNKPAPVYAIGDILTCRKESNASKYMTEGWSSQEKECTWTDGSEASMFFDVLDAQNKRLQLKMKGSAFLGGILPFQSVEVYANEHKIADWKVRNAEASFEAAIAPEIVNEGLLQIKFLISDPTSPKDVMQSEDGRKLGIAVKELVISEM